MWPARYFAARMWASRFWPKVGADSAVADVMGTIAMAEELAYFATLTEAVAEVLMSEALVGSAVLTEAGG